ncbi:MAG: hypothetical protein M9921_05980 [Fimbriimonadaceae bacterium]|nr:hypothetical protein [Chthonomonadaceae bacterium]MCO5296388.1 hypothetical protein [Fimbriimonadaceae bacterium]
METNQLRLSLEACDGLYAARAYYGAVVARYGPVEPYQTLLQARTNQIEWISSELATRGQGIPSDPFWGHLAAPPSLLACSQEAQRVELRNRQVLSQVAVRLREQVRLRETIQSMVRASNNIHEPLLRLANQNGGLMDRNMMNRQIQLLRKSHPDDSMGFAFGVASGQDRVIGGHGSGQGGGAGKGGAGKGGGGGKGRGGRAGAKVRAW